MNILTKVLGNAIAGRKHKLVPKGTAKKGEKKTDSPYPPKKKWTPSPYRNIRNMS